MVLQRFLERVREAGGSASTHKTLPEAINHVADMASKHRLILGVRLHDYVARNLEKRLKGRGITLLRITPLSSPGKSVLSGAGLSIGVADAGVAETGSILYLTLSAVEEAAIFSPETHIAILDSHAIIPELTGISNLLSKAFGKGYSAYLITGPSSTGDIEGEIIRGVHASRFLHVAVYGEGL